MITRGRGRVLAAMAIGVAVSFFPTAATGQPSAREILYRVLKANADTPDVTSADVLFKLRIKKPLGVPPDCEFLGSMQMAKGHQTVKIERRSAGLVCWAVDQYVIGRLFEASEPMEGFLSRFDFHVLGEKLEGNEHYFLLAGKARDPKNNPTAMIGWVSYERALITEGTIEFNWGSIDSEQRYARVGRAWLLSYQYLYTARFDASLEVTYSNFRFGR